MWVLYAVLASISYAVFNYLSVVYNPNIIGGKVVNSIVLALGALFIHLIQGASHRHGD